MAEFCIDCFNSINHTGYRESDVTLDDDYCEGCGVWKPCIMALHPPSMLTRFKTAIQNRAKTNRPRIIKRPNGATKITQQGAFVELENLPLDIQTGYIRLFGAVSIALDELAKVKRQHDTPEVQAARKVLESALEDTDGNVELL